MPASADEPRGITAILGPTNTGKTHQALQRMLEHRTGMIGLPLRLLAREVYDRLTTQVGEGDVALITGEEKRVPKRPRYFVCTVEAMPTSQEVDFLAVDEIQLCAHGQRGHVFTDRLLNARGLVETWFLGSTTIRKMLQRFVPTAKVVSRPRLSTLTATPTRTLSGLPPRSAVVAFSVERVYELATQLRNKRGGTAIVLGALSPRTRNAQVALYQSGEVDYMVATDAIGMGLNLDIDHVAFADFKKFDGQYERPLSTAELAQIAGRAGRYLNSGSFGTLSPLPEFNQEVVRAIEMHHFPSEVQMMWRNSDLDFSSVDALLQGLRSLPRHRGLRLMDSAEDQQAFAALSNRPAIRSRLTDADRIRLLWDVCQVPDFRQLWFELHVNLLEQFFLQLTGPFARIEPQFIEERLIAIDDVRGDIDTLMGRIANIRTWTYVASHRSWLTGLDALRDRTSAIEDRLSDALHEKLVVKFVERARTTSVGTNGQLFAKTGRYTGRFGALLEQYVATDTATLQHELDDRNEALVNASHEQFRVDMNGRISFEDKTVAQFEAGLDLLHPNIRLTNMGDLGPGVRSRMLRRLLAYARDVAQNLFAPLRVAAASELTPAARGLVYQLERCLGNVLLDDAREQLLALTDRDRQLLTSFGVHFGRRLIFVRQLLTPFSIAHRTALVSAHFSLPVDAAEFHPGSASLVVGERGASPWWLFLGYVVARPLAIRVDQFEAIWRQLDHFATQRSFAFPHQIGTKLGCSQTHLEQMLRHEGFTVASGRCSARPLRSERRKRTG